MIQAGKYYVNGTSAEKIQYDVYQENKVLKAKKNYKENNKLKYRMVLCILTVFAISCTVMYRYALITEMNYKLDKTYKIFNEIKDENQRLKVDIKKGTDLSVIKEIAEKKLGMQKPDKYQIAYVRVPKSDFTKLAATNNHAGKKEDNAFSSVFTKVGEFTGFLY